MTLELHFERLFPYSPRLKYSGKAGQGLAGLLYIPASKQTIKDV
jgi:hypothetical protein